MQKILLDMFVILHKNFLENILMVPIINKYIHYMEEQMKYK